MIQNKTVRMMLAIDPSESALSFNHAKLKELRQMTDHHEVELEAVYVAPLHQTDQDFIRKGLSPKAALQEMMDSFRLNPKVKCTVLKSQTSSQREKVNGLANYAKLKKVSIILLTSHGRKGIKRLVLGSFAESLMMSASMPVMILGEKSGSQVLAASTVFSSAAIAQTILYPTDFSVSSRVAFRFLLRQIELTNTHLILLHSSVLRTYNYDYGFTSIAGYLPDSYWEVHQSELVKLSSAWIHEAQKYGIFAKLILDESEATKLESIEAIAKENRISTIALAANHTHGLLRDLIHSQKFHLWICGPHAQAEGMKLDRRLAKPLPPARLTPIFRGKNDQTQSA